MIMHQSFCNRTPTTKNQPSLFWEKNKREKLRNNVAQGYRVRNLDEFDEAGHQTDCCSMPNFCFSVSPTSTKVTFQIFLHVVLETGKNLIAQ